MLRRGGVWAIVVGAVVVTVAGALWPIHPLVAETRNALTLPSLIAAAVLALVVLVGAKPSGRAVLASITAVGASMTIHVLSHTSDTAVLVGAALFLPAATSLGIRLAWPGSTRPVRRLVDSLATTGLLAQILRALVYDPFYDPACVVRCFARSSAMPAAPGLGRLLGVLALITLLTACAAGTLAAVRGPDRTGPTWYGRRVIQAGSMGLVGATAWLLLNPGSSHDHVWTGRALSVTLLTVCLSALLLGVEGARSTLRTARLRRLSAWLNSAEDLRAVEAQIGRAVRDPDLRIGYPTDAGGHVDGSGRSIDLSMSSVVTQLEFGGSSVAVVVHGRADPDPRLLSRSLTTKVAMAIQNESLRRRLAADVEQLQQARTRLVRSTEAARKALERNLHDGVQERLLGVLFAATKAQLLAKAAGRSDVVEQLSTMMVSANRCVAQVRTIARSVHPHLLTSSGLQPALAALTDTSTVPMTLRVAVDERIPSNTEQDVYGIVTALVAEGRAASRPITEVDVRIDGTAVVLTVFPVNRVGLSVIDRIDAGGGAWECRSIDGALDQLRVMLPCG